MNIVQLLKRTKAALFVRQKAVAPLWTLTSGSQITQVPIAAHSHQLHDSRQIRYLSGPCLLTGITVTTSHHGFRVYEMKHRVQFLARAGRRPQYAAGGDKDSTNRTACCVSMMVTGKQKVSASTSLCCFTSCKECLLLLLFRKIIQAWYSVHDHSRSSWGS